MKMNKGFGVLAALIIVVGVLAVGGGSYYLGKTSNPISDNSFPEEIPDDFFTNTTKDEITKDDCKKTDAPWIKVLSPNGGETFATGQQVVVKWDSCNVPTSKELVVSLGYKNNNIKENLVFSGALNNGSKTLTIPQDTIFKQKQYKLGKFYNVLIETPGIDAQRQSYVGDYSDNSFTINSKVVEKDCSTWSTFNRAYTVKYPSCWVASSFNGGSTGTLNQAVGVLLKPSIDSPLNDSISIGGFQYDCNQVNVSNGTSPAKKAYCIESITGDLWTGQYITYLNQGNVYGAPVTTHSTNPEVLKVFDQVVDRNKATASIKKNYAQLISQTPTVAVFKFLTSIKPEDVKPSNVLYCVKSVSATAQAIQPCETETSSINNFSLDFDKSIQVLTITGTSNYNTPDYGPFKIGCASCTSNIRFNNLHTVTNEPLQDETYQVY